MDKDKAIVGGSYEDLLFFNIPECRVVLSYIYVERNAKQFRHIYTGNTGVFVKEYRPTGRGLTTQIKMADGSVYFAPSHEFEEIK